MVKCLIAENLQCQDLIVNWNQLKLWKILGNNFLFPESSTIINKDDTVNKTDESDANQEMFSDLNPEDKDYKEK